MSPPEDPVHTKGMDMMTRPTSLAWGNYSFPSLVNAGAAAWGVDDTASTTAGAHGDGQTQETRIHPSHSIIPTDPSACLCCTLVRSHRIQHHQRLHQRSMCTLPLLQIRFRCNVVESTTLSEPAATIYGTCTTAHHAIHHRVQHQYRSPRLAMPPPTPPSASLPDHRMLCAAMPYHG